MEYLYVMAFTSKMLLCYLGHGPLRNLHGAEIRALGMTAKMANQKDFLFKREARKYQIRYWGCAQGGPRLQWNLVDSTVMVI